MELSRNEEYRNQKVSIGVTVFSFLVMLAFFVFTNIITANSSPVTALPEVELSMYNGTGENPGPGEKATPSIASKQELTKDKIQESYAEGEIIPVKNNITENTNTGSEVIVPAKEPGGFHGTESGSPGLGYDLGERNIISAPNFSNDTQEEGKVIVDIVVDKNGTVIEAYPNGRGTNTSSTRLKSEARKMALATKFSTDQKLDEQRGTITIIFSFK